MASLFDIVKYYQDLLILQYKGKPKAYATIGAVIQPIIMDQLPMAVQDAFDLETASGVQLDVIGKYVGASRDGYSFSGPISLDDNDFRVLIKLRIAENNSGSSLADIQNILYQFFAGAIRVYDYADMRLSYLFTTETASLQFVQMLVKQGLLPKPMAVQVNALIYAPVIDRFFGFRTYDYAGFANSPFNTYDAYDLTTPWLTYSDAIGP